MSDLLLWQSGMWCCANIYMCVNHVAQEQLAHLISRASTRSSSSRQAGWRHKCEATAHAIFKHGMLKHSRTVCWAFLCTVRGDGSGWMQDTVHRACVSGSLVFLCGCVNLVCNAWCKLIERWISKGIESIRTIEPAILLFGVCNPNVNVSND